jgi:arylsulfatase A-like enzyme
MQDQRPHIIIFNPDQWRGDAVGHYGNPAAQTPVLDRLAAAEAVSFSNTYCQNTVCTPSRCSYLTGWYPHVRGHRTMFHMLHSEHGEPMMLRQLKEAGYKVAWFGKNDVVPGQGSFTPYADIHNDYDASLLQPSWHGPVYEAARGKKGSDTYYSFYNGRMEKLPGEKYYHDNDWIWVQSAIELIRNHEGDEPLCIYLPLIYPHPPYGVEEPFFSMIDRSKLPPRAPFYENPELAPSVMRALRDRFGMAEWSEDRWDELRAVYYGMCAKLDALLGDLIEALQEKGYWDRTALFFFPDHGDFTGDYDIVEKTQNTFQDNLARVPLLIKPPKNRSVAPRVCGALTELIDVTETIYEWTGVDPDYDRFGRSLSAVIAGETDEHRDAVFCEGGRRIGEQQAMEWESVNRYDDPTVHPYWPRMGLQISDDEPYHSKAVMCRTKRYKYIHRLYETDEFYDLQSDPQELRNLINDPESADEIARHRLRLLDWYQETCDVVPRSTDSR